MEHLKIGILLNQHLKNNNMAIIISLLSIIISIANIIMNIRYARQDNERYEEFFKTPETRFNNEGQTNGTWRLHIDPNQRL